MVYCLNSFPALIYRQKIWPMHAGLLHVNHTCLKPVCPVFSLWATYAAASSVSHQQWAKDQPQSYLFTKYSRNRKQNAIPRN